MESLTDPAALLHEELDVPAALSPFVARRMRTWSEEPVEFVMTLPPTGSIFLTLVFGDPMTLEFEPGEQRRAPELFIGGQLRNRLPVSRVQGRVGITGFEFTPTGFHRLFHQDCSALTDRAAPLDELIPEPANALRGELDVTRDIHGKMALLQSFLLERVAEARDETVVDRAVARIEAVGGWITVAELARECHLSERQLNRRFLREVGIGPKHFAKVVQLKHAMATLHSGDSNSLRTLAQRAGYFDQSHFINDFQRLVGTNPLAFLHAGESFLRTYMRHQRN
jgi:AraC-like DNA-binding protein